jgi:hypothetical protein
MTRLLDELSPRAELLPHREREHPEAPSGLCMLFTTIAADEPVELVVTVGRTQDPGQCGAQPPHVHIERYIPQRLVRQWHG